MENITERNKIGGSMENITERNNIRGSMENRKEIICDLIEILKRGQYKDLSYLKSNIHLCEAAPEVQEFKQFFKDFILPMNIYNNLSEKDQYRLFLLNEDFLQLLKEQNVQEYIHCVHQLQLKSTFDEKDFYEALLESQAKIEKNKTKEIPFLTKLKHVLIIMEQENEVYLQKVFKKIGRR